MTLRGFVEFSLLLVLTLGGPMVLRGEGGGASDWKEAVEAACASTSPVDDEALLALSRRAPSWNALRDRLRSLPCESLETNRLLRGSHRCLDGVDRPWVLWVPSTYRPDRPTPLFVHLHGAVSRESLRDDPEGYARQKPYLPFCEERGWLCLFVFGQKGATWWDQVGMENVEGSIGDVRRRCNVDDDRVWLEGFSDGGSAAFLMGMVRPSSFAALVALNGHLGVGSLDGDLPTYLGNLANTPVYATTTDEDELYPTRYMAKTLHAAIDSGAHLLYRIRKGRHAFDFADTELPRIARFLEGHPRDPFPPRIDWEAGDERFGRCHWIEIRGIASGPAASWHVDRNVVMTNHRLTIGFHVDESHSGPGLRVKSLSDGATLAKGMGLQEGDLLLRADGQVIGSDADLNRWKAAVTRGAPCALEVSRGARTMTLHGQIPLLEHHYLFKRQRPSARVRAHFMGNLFEIETSRVDALRLFVYDEMVDLDQDMVVRINGVTRYRGGLSPDRACLLRSYLRHRDRRRLPLAALDFDLSASGE